MTFFKGYFHENEEEVDASLHYIQKIIDLAGNIKKTIILIPSVDDLEKIYVDNLDYKNLYWFKNFEKFSKINNLKLIDLADFENTYLIKKDIINLFLINVTNIGIKKVTNLLFQNILKLYNLKNFINFLKKFLTVYLLDLIFLQSFNPLSLSLRILAIPVPTKENSKSIFS